MSDTPLKVAIVIHSGVDTREGTMKVCNALESAKDFKEGGDYIDVISDGEGTRTAVLISQPDHRLYKAFKDVEEIITGVCHFCIVQQNMADASPKAGLDLLDEYHNHPSYRNLIKSGYQVLSF